MAPLRISSCLSAASRSSSAETIWAPGISYEAGHSGTQFAFYSQVLLVALYQHRSASNELQLLLRSDRPLISRLIAGQLDEVLELALSTRNASVVTLPRTVSLAFSNDWDCLIDLSIPPSRRVRIRGCGASVCGRKPAVIACVGC